MRVNDSLGRARVVVIGIGNEFRRDDGVGWAVVARLGARTEALRLSPNTELAMCDGEPARLVSLWEKAALAVVVDAGHRAPSCPGRIHRLELDGDLDLPLQRADATSSHGFGLGDAVELARVLERLPRRLVVYAVEGTDFGPGTGLSAPTAAAVEPLTERIARDVAHPRSRCHR